jgi:hypothetical protein
MATTGSTGWDPSLAPSLPCYFTVYSRLSSTRLPTLMPTAMGTGATMSTGDLLANTRNVCQRVRPAVIFYTDQITDFATARGTGDTDGTSDATDFASRIRTAKHGPHHNVALTTNQVGSAADSNSFEEPSSPMPAFHAGYDGHRSQTALRSSINQHHEDTSDRSYRSGPSVESGSS